MAALECLGLLPRRAALRMGMHIYVACSVKLISIDPESQDFMFGRALVLWHYALL